MLGMQVCSLYNDFKTLMDYLPGHPSSFMMEIALNKLLFSFLNLEKYLISITGRISGPENYNLSNNTGSMVLSNKTGCVTE